MIKRMIHQPTELVQPKHPNLQVTLSRLAQTLQPEQEYLVAKPAVRPNIYCMNSPTLTHHQTIYLLLRCSGFDEPWLPI